MPTNKLFVASLLASAAFAQNQYASCTIQAVPDQESTIGGKILLRQSSDPSEQLYVTGWLSGSIAIGQL